MCVVVYKWDMCLPFSAVQVNTSNWLILVRRDYSLLSWSNLKPVDAEFILTSWAQEEGIEVIEIVFGSDSHVRQVVCYINKDIKPYWTAQFFQAANLLRFEIFHHMICLFPKDLVPSFWRQSVSYREVWAAEHYESLDLDPRDPRAGEVWYGLDRKNLEKGIRCC